ncbi:MAG: efflux RND transporter periplasmic adaptor subunit [Kiritimatiellae bacterium]|nr:efflux RND transporter periplasmic adaptor subunit [Kiritimatiellia bacterium]
MTSTKYLLPALLAAALALPAAAQEEGATPDAPPPPAGPKPSMFLVGVGKASIVDHRPVRTFSGRVLSTETVAIVAQVAGEVVEVSFEEGAVLRKGDPMYRIDPVPYEAAAAAARAQVAQAAASADYARKSFDRAQALFEKNVASPDDLDSATSAKASAEAALAAAEAALVTAENNLAHCAIAAPVDGKAGLNAATVGNYVSTASGPLTTLVRQDPVRVAFAPGSRDYLAVFGGESGLRGLFDVRLRLADGSAYPLDAAVEFVGNAVNASTDTMPVYARFPNPDGLLVPGATVKVEVQARNPARMVSVPLTALLHDGDQAYVWMVGEGNLPVRRDVTAGPASATYQTILDGLSEGEEIIVTGTHKVVPGVPVEPVKL